MKDFLLWLYDFLDFLCALFLIWLSVYSFWHGLVFETGDLRIELYGISRFFK